VGPSRAWRMTAVAVEEGRAGLATRIAAARLLSAIVDKHVSLDGLTDNKGGNPAFLALSSRDRALVRGILMTALRYRNSIETLIASRLNRPLPENARMLSHILHVAAAQILFLDIPDRAAVDLAVQHASDDPRTKKYAGLVNAVLRRIAERKQRALPTVLSKTVDAPEWFHNRMIEAYGTAKAARILEMHRHEAPVDLTVKSDPEGWARRLGGTTMPNGTVRLVSIEGSITDLEGFTEGAWWVQDAASSLPARLFGDIRGKRVADLCAAPGGKTAQLALAGAFVTAVDISDNRLKRLRENLARLGLEAETIKYDASKYQPDRPFDAVLVDAPCSSTGTIRRHPDIAWVKSDSDIVRLAEVQGRLLLHAIDLASPGGTIVFSNCSLDPREGEYLVETLLRENTQVEIDPVRKGEFSGLDEFITPAGTIRTTPADWPRETPRLSGLDGFFSARLRRI
jgi:16S rRNA (cytosine967-C5)-methyltransferase